MKGKKYLYLFFIFITLFCLFYFCKKSKRGTYIKYFSKKKFYEKKINSPIWINKQIATDFASINIINQQSLEKTFQKIKNNLSLKKLAFFRYRIVNNKFYRFYPENEEINFSVLDFEKAIVTLCKVIKLPDIDFIYCDLDGLPLDDVDENFYKTEDSSPIFCHAKIKGCKKLILIPDHNSLSNNWKIQYLSILEENKKINWNEKIEKAFWRGGSNDQTYTEENFYEKPRIIISMMSNKNFDLLDAGITKSWFFQLKHFLIKEKILKDVASIEKHLKYKFLPVLDGFMCTYPGYQWRLLSNSICFKQDSDQIQWFYSALEPYKHCIPIKNDMSDLLEKINWAKNNGEKCFKIAKNATEFALNNLSMEAIYVYLYEVLQRYSIKQNFDKQHLIKDIKKDVRWICINDRKRADKILKLRTKKK